MNSWQPIGLDTSGEYWYRYNTVGYSNGTDEFGDPKPGHSTRVEVVKYRVIRYTPKGVWLEGRYGPFTPRFVLKEARRRFACPTKAEALISYMARQKRRIEILSGQIDDSRQGISIATALLKREESES